MNLRELQTEAHAIAVDKGWWDTERTFGDLIALVHGELSEALKAYCAPAWEGDLGWRYVPILDDETAEIIGNKPVGVASALADVVIRVAEMAEHYGVDLQSQKTWERLSDYWKAYRETIRQQRTFGEWIAVCCSWLSHVFDEREVGSRPWAPYLRRFLEEVQAMAEHYGIDLDAAIAAKMEYMRGRWVIGDVV